MKTFLRALLGWLDRKFPDRVIVTVAEYESLKAEIKRLNDNAKLVDEWAMKVKERLEKAEVAIGNLNVASGLNNLAADKFKVTSFVR